MKPAAPHPRLPAARRRNVSVAALLMTLLLGAAALCAPPASATAASTSTALKAGDVTLTILDVTPLSPTPDSKQTLKVTFRLRNNTSSAIDGVSVSGVRGNPTTSQAGLDQDIAHPSPPDPSLVAPIQSAAIVQAVPAGRQDTVDAVFTSSTDLAQDAGVCICADAIYPLYFTATSATGTVLATAQTYIPSFSSYGVTDPATPPQPLKVGWVWPLLDRPHRLTTGTEFIDDDLAAEVAPGGRLDRALQVVEMVSSEVPITILTDPELIDELDVMASGKYTVLHAGKPSTPGVGSMDAALWLQRLRAVLDLHSADGTEIDLTPLGDPDVEAAQRAGLTWTSGLDATTQAQITAALGGRTPLSDIAWPADETLSSSTLNTLVQHGITTVILNSSTLPVGINDAPSPNAIAPLSTKSGTAIAAVTSAPIESWTAKVMDQGGGGTADLPQLVAQVALHAVQDVGTSHFLLITPPRNLDVDPTAAAAAILATSNTFWSTPITLRQAAQSITPVNHGPLVTQKIVAIPAQALQALHAVSYALTGLTSMFADTPAAAATEIGDLPETAQLALSSSLVSDPTQAVSYAQHLQHEVEAIRHGVYLHPPANGKYTLTSSKASLPVTITNDLPVPVEVDLDAFTIGGLPGFQATPISNHTIAANSTVQVRIRTQFDRAGSIEVAVRLSTPSGLGLGRPISLSVRSTALGTIGVVITAIAGCVLVIALLVRLITRLRRRGRPKPKPVTT